MFALLALSSIGSASTTQQVPIGGIDHVLIWSRTIDQITSIMAVKLGFQVRPGGDFGDGVANRVIPFSDRSYLELLHFTRPHDKLTGEARDAYAATEQGPTANMFALEAGNIAEIERHLRETGWKLSPSTPLTYDPDGDGPAPARESMWRTVGFDAPPLSSADLFFIKYNEVPSNAADEADRVVFSRHPNTAQRISAMWLLSADAEAEGKRISRLGVRQVGLVTLPEQGLRGFRFESGGETILALEPSGPGPAADALQKRGPHIYGISIAAADVAQARRIAEWGYGREMRTYEGLFGKSFAAPTYPELGFLVEFHQSSSR
ncbi:MAG: VOC family protein [Sphingomonas sp.]|nr:VOC family protein [Sphingomonas sp.]